MQRSSKIQLPPHITEVQEHLKLKWVSHRSHKSGTDSTLSRVEKQRGGRKEVQIRASLMLWWGTAWIGKKQERKYSFSNRIQCLWSYFLKPSPTWEMGEFLCHLLKVRFSFMEKVQILGITRENVLLVPGGAFRGGIWEVTQEITVLGKISSAQGLLRAGLEGFKALWM